MLVKLDTRRVLAPWLSPCFDRDRVADYQKMVAQLRDANIRAELYLGKSQEYGQTQLKYATGAIRRA